ncbi:MAG TPA: Mur ligase family protein [Candidatus Paceibacterota bacterium]
MKEITKAASKSLVILILTYLAKKVLHRYQPKIIAITGSVGKTTTKDAIYAAVSPYKLARKSEKSFNSEIGVPLTILGCRNAWLNLLLWLENFLRGLWLILKKQDYPDWLVLEVGADRPGDIQKISTWLKPDIVVVTHIPKIPVHVEYFSSPQELLREKMFIAKALKEKGVLILNADDEDVLRLGQDIQRKKVTYGLKNNADVVAGDVLFESKIENGVELPTGMVFNLITDRKETPVNINNVLGNHIALSCAAATAVALQIGITLIDVSKGLSRFSNPAGRMSLIKGIKNSIIIDDTYNSSPGALEEALETLQKINTNSRKISVLGDMLELGRFSIGEHRRLGKITAKVSDILVTVGLRARDFAMGALDGGMKENHIFQYENSVEAGKEIQNFIKTGDILLVKGSQGVRMEKCVEEIMAQPERKEELLVRQSKEWKNK